MNIGILTFHNNENKGALLQAYAMRQIIKERIPQYNVELIDYRTRTKELERLLSIPKSGFSRQTISRAIDYVDSNRFFSKKGFVSDKQIITDDYHKSLKQINDLKYDAIYVGSDEVWKIPSKQSDAMFSTIRPFPNAYFLGEEIKAKKYAYAVSANRTNVEKLTERERTFVKNSARDFNLISVRDHFTKSFLETIGVENVKMVPDPTIMYDFEDEISKTDTPKLDIYGKTLGIRGAEHPIYKTIADKFREKGYTIIAPTNSKFSDVDLNITNPFKYLKSFSEFDMVVTTSLHATIFCITQNTPFLTIDVSDSYSNQQSKTESLLIDFNLLDNHCSIHKDRKDKILKKALEMENNNCFEDIESHMRRLKGVGNEFLQMTIEDLESSEEDGY